MEITKLKISWHVDCIYLHTNVLMRHLGQLYNENDVSGGNEE